MSTLKVKLTPLTPINVSHPEPLFPVETKQDILLQTPSTATQTPDLSALLDWRFDELPSQLPDLPPTPEELNMMFSSHFPRVFGSFTAQPPRGEHLFPVFDSGDYDDVGAFGADKQPFPNPLGLHPADLWELTQNMSESLFSKPEFIPEVQEIRFVDSGFEEFAGFGIDFDEPPPQSPSEGSSDGHTGSS